MIGSAFDFDLGYWPSVIDILTPDHGGGLVPLQRRNNKTRPRLWWPTEAYGDWPSGLCSVCAVPCMGDTQYWFQFEEGRDRMCRYCHGWAKDHLKV